MLLNHLFNSTTILCMSFLNTWRLEFVITKLISSAYKTGLDITDMILGRALIYKRKTKEPSTKPWGTPSSTVCLNQGKCVCTFLKTYIRYYIIRAWDYWPQNYSYYQRCNGAIIISIGYCIQWRLQWTGWIYIKHTINWSLGSIN